MFNESESFQITDHHQLAEFIKKTRLYQRRPQNCFDGISQAKLSKLERGVSACDVNSLVTIARELGFKLMLVPDPDAMDRSHPTFARGSKEQMKALALQRWNDSLKADAEQRKS